ncbi:MAG TPA: signal peptide peptidase SppA [bacterium]|nr:signal peptide peptidase SppA [bacterium]HPR86875.1 signal peptide peptidase SppA [bacterium]
MEQFPPYSQSPASPAAPRRKSRWWIVLLIFAILFLFGVIALIAGFFALIKGPFTEKTVEIRPGSVVELRIRGDLEENLQTAPLTLFGGETQSATMLDLLNGIQRAKTDARIRGLYYRSGDLSCGMAKAAEIRDALLDFKSSGKFFTAYLDFGSELDYFFASAADSIFMPTEGLLELNGFAIEELFWKETLDKIGVQFYVEQFEEFKSAGEPYSRTGFSAPARESLRALLQQRLQTFLQAVAASRKIDYQAAAAALDRGMYTSDSLLALGFIDAICPEGYVRDQIQRQKADADTTGKKSPLVTMANYVRSADRNVTPVVEGKQIALIYASGIIVSGETEANPLLNEAMVASRDFVRYIRQAREDKRIKAIILRIDSPGGSVMAADEIWEELERTREVKPLYASMSDVAASGGYYIAMACDTIIAHPQSITGSIGVISTIPNLSGALAKIGAHVDTLKSSDAALFLNPLLPFSAGDKRLYRQMSANIYQRFVQRVADSRSKSFEETRLLARGRVWTGEAALTNGLVDTLGGLRTALNIAKRRIGIPVGQKVRLRIYPQPQEPWDAFRKLFDLISQENGGKSRSIAPPAPGSGWAAAWPASPLLPEPLRHQLGYLLLLHEIGSRERVLAALPSIAPLQIR